jgi:hypothetical protein
VVCFDTVGYTEDDGGNRYLGEGETLCLCLAQGNECLGQIRNSNLILLMRC